MKTKKIKIFLGGFINLSNAQNLNCLALAQYLNKERFNVYALEMYSGNIDSKKEQIYQLKTFNCFYPAKISMYLGFFWGIFNCDIAYLPKLELSKWNRFWLNLLNKKSFTTIEGIIDATALKNTIDSIGSKTNYLNSRKKFDKIFSITHYMRKYNYEKIGLKTDDKVLYLGVNYDNIQITTTRISLRNIIMIGNDLVRKGVHQYLELASKFPDTLFFVAGSGNGKIDLDAKIKSQNLKNVIYKGLLKSTELIGLLKECDLHVLPSRSEGFPKVTLEAATVGVPSLLYADYGAEEWITHNHNGWIVNNLKEMTQTITKLIKEPELLKSNSKNTRELVKKFDWKNIITKWEEEIENLYDR